MWEIVGSKASNVHGDRLLAVFKGHSNDDNEMMRQNIQEGCVNSECTCLVTEKRIFTLGIVSIRSVPL